MFEVSSLLTGPAILPIVQADNVNQALSITEAVRASGLTNVEVVRRTDAAADSVAAIRKAMPDMVVGMGTIMSSEQVKEAVDVGSQFIVTPASSPALLTALCDAQIPFVPGTANPADVLLATEYGLTEMKFFPASLVGGTPMLKALGAVFKQVRFCPTGGISGNNMAEYLSLSNVFAVGGTWMIPAQMVKDKDWDGITRLCQQAAQAAS